MMKFMLLEGMEALGQLVCRLVKVAAAASASAALACHFFLKAVFGYLVASNRVIGSLKALMAINVVLKLLSF
jgi:hypothetical protein